MKSIIFPYIVKLQQDLTEIICLIYCTFMEVHLRYSKLQSSIIGFLALKPRRRSKSEKEFLRLSLKVILESIGRLTATMPYGN